MCDIVLICVVLRALLQPFSKQLLKDEHRTGSYFNAITLWPQVNLNPVIDLSQYILGLPKIAQTQAPAAFQTPQSLSLRWNPDSFKDKVAGPSKDCK